jgi:lysophospholipase L1-like esterase
MRCRAFTVACGCVAVAASVALGGVAQAASPPMVYVAMGDSVTQVTQPGAVDRYPEKFFAFLQRQGAADRLLNVGVSGETTSSILGGQLQTALADINDTATNVSVVTLDIGANDLLGSADCFPVRAPAGCDPVIKTAAGNLDRLLTSLSQALASDPPPNRLMLMTYYNPVSGSPGLEPLAAAVKGDLLGDDGKMDCNATGTDVGLNDVITCLGRVHGADIVDTYPLFEGRAPTLVIPFDIHPTDAGHAVIADAFASSFSMGNDLTAPVITLPPAVEVDATSSVGAAVSYTATATDNSDAHPSLMCTPPSGATFPIGTTSVVCTATDAAGNSSTATLRVTVRGVEPQLVRLAEQVARYDLEEGTAKALAAKLDKALRSVRRGQHHPACRALDSFARFARRERGDDLTAGQADGLLGAAVRIRSVLAC